MDPFIFECLQRLRKLHTDMEGIVAGLSPAALSWIPCPGANTIAALVQHTCRAQRFLIADTIGGRTEHQDGSADFDSPGKNGAALLADLNQTLALSETIIERLSAADLGESRNMPKHSLRVSVSWCILHAIDHTAQHLGHLELTHQLWKQRGEAGS